MQGSRSEDNRPLGPLFMLLTCFFRVTSGPTKYIPPPLGEDMHAQLYGFKDSVALRF